MTGSKSIFSIWHITSSLFMVVALLWLTISTPFVYAANQIQKQQIHNQADRSDNNPFSNTTEEKNESSVNTLSEYLHDLHPTEHNFTVLTKYYKCHSSDLYRAYHPELISPPPEA